MDIYCENCGSRNDASSQFCENCGYPIKPIEQASKTQSAPKSRSWISRMASIGASIVIIFFFLPWATVSCSSNLVSLPIPISASGYQIASGQYPLINDASSLYSLLNSYGLISDSTEISQLTQQISAPFIWLILICGIMGLLSLAGGRTGGTIALIAGIVGVIVLIVLGIKLSEINSQISLYGFKIRTEIGIVVEWLGFLFMILIGVLSLLFIKTQEKKTSH